MYRRVEQVDNFSTWRDIARKLLQADMSPLSVEWQAPELNQQVLFAAPPELPATKLAITVPSDFFELAKVVAMHNDPDRWGLLYRVAWRLTHGEKNLLHIETDDDVRAMFAMKKAISHEIHKMRAFVRFRKVETSGREQFIAWYEPYHHTLEANAKFFVDRFRGMEWAILTPAKSMYWDKKELRYGPGVARSDAPGDDSLDDMWRSYYAAIYNPARLSLDAMRAQLPVQRWKDLPEARIIPELVRTSRGMVQDMADKQPVSASVFIPEGASSLDDLRGAVQACWACGLCPISSGPVFGEGPESARIVLVGEQPGDEEDRQRRPFVGPAGRVLDGAMEEAGLNRSDLYLTNAVKSFKFIERGKRRIHQTPRPSEIGSCRPWLTSELALVKPKVIVALGGTAGQSVMGRTVRINAERGKPLEHPSASAVVITFHPSAILRAPDESVKRQQQSALVADLKLAASLAATA